MLRCFKQACVISLGFFNTVCEREEEKELEIKKNKTDSVRLKLNIRLPRFFVLPASGL